MCSFRSVIMGLPLLLLACLIFEISAFQVPQTILVSSCLSSSSKQQQQQQRNNFLLLRVKPDDDDTVDDGQVNDGADLAKEFFRQQREREKRNFQGQVGSSSDTVSSTPTTPRPNIDLTRSLFDDDEPSSQSIDDENPPKRKKKFTGRRDDFTSSSSSSPPQVISSRSSSSRIGGGGHDIRSPREVMMQREYELVGRAERGLGLQAIFAVLALAFYIYVGATGGIVSGSDAISDDFGGDDTIYFEQTMPIQRDSENSVFI